MVLKLYGHEASIAVRAVLLTLKALELDYEMIEVDILKGEQLKPEYLKLNPLHTIPTIVDDDFVVWDSHVISTYLVDKYGKDDSLYPKDLQKRAVVDSLLYFQTGIFVPKYGVVAVTLRETPIISNEKARHIIDAYEQLETLLQRSTYVAGETLTVADFSIIAAVTSANVLVPVASNRFPKISEWMTKLKALPYYAEANQRGVDIFVDFFKKMT